MSISGSGNKGGSEVLNKSGFQEARLQRTPSKYEEDNPAKFEGSEGSSVAHVAQVSHSPRTSVSEASKQVSPSSPSPSPSPASSRRSSSSDKPDGEAWWDAGGRGRSEKEWKQADLADNEYPKPRYDASGFLLSGEYSEDKTSSLSQEPKTPLRSSVSSADEGSIEGDYILGEPLGDNADWGANFHQNLSKQEIKTQRALIVATYEAGRDANSFSLLGQAYRDAVRLEEKSGEASTIRNAKKLYKAVPLTRAAIGAMAVRLDTVSPTERVDAFKKCFGLALEEARRTKSDEALQKVASRCHAFAKHVNDPTLLTLAHKLSADAEMEMQGILADKLKGKPYQLTIKVSKYVLQGKNPNKPMNEAVFGSLVKRGIDDKDPIKRQEFLDHALKLARSSQKSERLNKRMEQVFYACLENAWGGTAGAASRFLELARQVVIDPQYSGGPEERSALARELIWAYVGNANTAEEPESVHALLNLAIEFMGGHSDWLDPDERSAVRASIIQGMARITGPTQADVPSMLAELDINQLDDMSIEPLIALVGSFDMGIVDRGEVVGVAATVGNLVRPNDLSKPNPLQFEYDKKIDIAQRMGQICRAKGLTDQAVLFQSIESSSNIENAAKEAHLKMADSAHRHRREEIIRNHQSNQDAGAQRAAEASKAVKAHHATEAWLDSRRK